MANPPRLQVSGLPGINGEDSGETTSPARGAEMRNFLQTRLQKNRAPPLVHAWDFWHDRQDRPAHETASNSKSEGKYEDRLVLLAPIVDVRAFWNVFNNFDIARLPLRDSVHLFHKGVKPVWEDPRNSRGGSWTFRVPKSQASEFWKEMCMMAIGEQLQAAVESERQTFRDDICGVSLAVRFNSMLVQIWNRDGEHEAGVQKILETVLGNLSPELQPKEGSYYYKKHTEHSGFTAPPQTIAGSIAPVGVATNDTRPTESGLADSSSQSRTAEDASRSSLSRASAMSPPGHSVDDPAMAESTMRRTAPPGTDVAAVSEKSKNSDPIDDMKGVLGRMKSGMDNLDQK